jgi:hypothetical protein
MSVTMTIHEARQMQADDVALDDDAVRQAEAEATEAEEAAATLERSAVEGGKGSAAPAAVVEQRAVAEFARTRAHRIRQRADRAKAARRVLALADVGKDVEQVAAAASAPSASIAAAVQKIADGRDELMRLAAEHDAKVAALMTRAKALGVEPPMPGSLGPRASSAHVALARSSIVTGPGGIQSGNAIVGLIGTQKAAEAAQLAASGDGAKALRTLGAAQHVKPPKHADRYWRLANGLVEPFNDQDPHRVRQAAEGEIDFLTDDERAAYLDGRFDGHRAIA